MSRQSSHFQARLTLLLTCVCLISAASQQQQGDVPASQQRQGVANSRRRDGALPSQHRVLPIDMPSIVHRGVSRKRSSDKSQVSFIVRAEPVPIRILRVVPPESSQGSGGKPGGSKPAEAEVGASGGAEESGETWTEAEEIALVTPKGVAFYHRGKNGGGGGGSGGAGTRLAAPIDITPGKGRQREKEEVGEGRSGTDVQSGVKRGTQAPGGKGSNAGKFPVLSGGGNSSSGGAGGSAKRKKRGGPNGGWTLAKERRVSFSTAQEMRFGNGQFGKGGKVTYHGGPVMANSPIKVYTIFYGDWDKTTIGLFHKFVSSISGKYSTPKDRYNVTRWWSFTAAGTQADGRRVSDEVVLGRSVLDRNYVSGGGKVLRNYQKDIVGIINYHLRNKLLPFDTDGIYMVMTDPTVEVKSRDPKDGFCTRFCGYHSYGQDALGKTLKFGFAGHSARCPSQCTRPLSYDTFNGINVDATISTFAHEIAEVAIDPLFTAWYDHDQVEGADKCTYIYGDGWVNPRDSAAYNLMGRRGSRFLIQSSWSNVKQMCVQ